MNIYRVGGAVRDRLLGYPHTETDWVVVGATPEDMLSQGYRQVGRDFPVFLHPDTQRNTPWPAPSGKPVTATTASRSTSPLRYVEEDLARRDLTVNAMALAEDDTLIDPYGGERDLQAKCLRHVASFVEDALRVLRVARFAARYADRIPRCRGPGPDGGYRDPG